MQIDQIMEMSEEELDTAVARLIDMEVNTYIETLTLPWWAGHWTRKLVFDNIRSFAHRKTRANTQTNRLINGLVQRLSERPADKCKECGQPLEGDVVFCSVDFIICKKCHDQTTEDWEQTKEMLIAEGHKIPCETIRRMEEDPKGDFDERL